MPIRTLQIHQRFAFNAIAADKVITGETYNDTKNPDRDGHRLFATPRSASPLRKARFAQTYPTAASIVMPFIAGGGTLSMGIISEVIRRPRPADRRRRPDRRRAAKLNLNDAGAPDVHRPFTQRSPPIRSIRRLMKDLPYDQISFVPVAAIGDSPWYLTNSPFRAVDDIVKDLPGNPRRSQRDSGSPPFW